MAPEGVECHLYDRLADLPAFNPDDDRHPLDPEVQRLRAAIHQADAILFSTPEYAGALPGSLKNLLDWTIGDEEPGFHLREAGGLGQRVAPGRWRGPPRTADGVGVTPMPG